MKRRVMFLIASVLAALTLSSCVWVGGHGYYYRRPHDHGYYHYRYYDDGYRYRDHHRGHHDLHREKSHY